MAKFSGLTFFVSLILMLSFFLPVAADSIEKPTDAPDNPEFLEYLDALLKGKLDYFTNDGLPAEWNPSPVTLSHVKGIIDAEVIQSYPSKYDLRLENRVTPVRDQGNNCGSSWAFAALASLESCLMPGENTDFSEYDLISSHGFDYGECDGGGDRMAAAYLVRWDGPANESSSTYPYSATMSTASSARKHVQEVVQLPTRTGYLDNDTLKYFVLNFGALYSRFRWESSYFNNTHNSYYYNGSKNTNHKVAVVGWDDNFPASRFNRKPPGNGAFIVKDSWGKNWADNGYLYISYFDACITDFVCFKAAESKNNYAHIYQYDPLGRTNASGYGDTTAWGANIFTAAGDEAVKAVGFFTTDANVNYSIFVYTDVSANSPRSGILAASKTGKKTYPGYYTVKLDSPVALTQGESFSVVIKFTNSNYTYPVPIEKPRANYSSNATANLGESFISHFGSSWYDKASDNSNTNICIKAYTANTSGGGLPEAPPFGSFDTPADGSLISGSVAVTGWALDDSRVMHVKIYLQQGSTLFYIGDADFVEDARTDIAEAYPEHPYNNRAGWGYMLLSNFLPNSGNGRFVLHAIATDNIGQTTTLGTKTIHCNNAAATKPFGSIDFPRPGEEISGTYRIAGWVLTPPPNKIPENGSTIRVLIDGKDVGHAVYNNSRPDIASYFPGYANSQKAGAYFDLDTTQYDSGVHQLAWVVTDSAGNAEGVGSRLFRISDGAGSINPDGSATLVIPSVGKADFPAGAFRQDDEPRIAKSTLKENEGLSVYAEAFYDVVHTLEYQIEINTGDMLPDSDYFEVEFQLPDAFADLIAGDLECGVYARIYQEKEYALLDDFTLFPSVYNPSNKTVKAVLPFWAFSNKRRRDKAWHALLTLAIRRPTSSERRLSSVSKCPKSGFQWPVKTSKVITCQFNTPREREMNVDGKKVDMIVPHTGIDIKADNGTPLYPVAEGKIVTFGRSKTWGYFIVVFHGDGKKTAYCHLSGFCDELVQHLKSINVTLPLENIEGYSLAGENQIPVTKNKIIGLSGGDESDKYGPGSSQKPHLHLEYFNHGRKVNPAHCAEQSKINLEYKCSVTVYDWGNDKDDSFKVCYKLSGAALVCLGNTPVGGEHTFFFNAKRKKENHSLKLTLLKNETGKGTCGIRLNYSFAFSDGSSEKRSSFDGQKSFPFKVREIDYEWVPPYEPRY